MWNSLRRASRIGNGVWMRLVKAASLIVAALLATHAIVPGMAEAHTEKRSSQNVRQAYASWHSSKPNKAQYRGDLARSDRGDWDRDGGKNGWDRSKDNGSDKRYGNGKGRGNGSNGRGDRGGNEANEGNEGGSGDDDDGSGDNESENENESESENEDGDVDIDDIFEETNT